MNIPNGIDLARFSDTRPAEDLREGKTGELVVGFVGRLVKEKGCAVLLAVAADCIAEFPKSRFVITGEGPERESLETLSKQLRLKQNVHFTGRREDMPAVYAAFDVCVLPSFVEAMPMTILEAMAAGNPVIATRIGEIPTTVENETTGILVAPNDARELREAILRLLRDGNLRRSMGQSGRARVQRHFSVERMSQSYVEIYRQICGVTTSMAQFADYAEDVSKLR